MLSEGTRRAQLLHDQAGQDQGSGGAAGGDTDTLGRVQDQLGAVQNVMRQNVDQMLTNIEHAQTLETSSAELSSNARAFQSAGRRVRKQMWWQNLKMKLYIGAAITAALLLILWWAGAFSSGGGGGGGGGDGGGGEPDARLRLRSLLGMEFAWKREERVYV